MFLVGLTGGVASGKTYVGTRFQQLGVPLIEADDVARDVVAAGSQGLAAIVERFGGEVLQPDGTLDRRRMRERVFSNVEDRRALENITHPLIRAAIERWRARRSEAYGILSAAIMLESGLGGRVDRVLLVDAPPAVQMQRLIERDGVEQALAARMLAAQLSREQRLPRAHDIIFNDGRAMNLDPQIARLHAFYGALGIPRGSDGAR